MMSKVYIENYPIPSASMGSENPLPDIKNNTYIHAQIETTSAITEEEKQRIGTGMISTLLPYTIQDRYDRHYKEKIYQAVILENDYLKAVFLPELGGRLWSLIDKEKNKELLYRNPVFQPGNLALRNAWFSGGVEFNVSIKGHNPLTCSPIFARKIMMEDGSEGVRLYEYERIRGVAYSLDAWIPKDSHMLYIRPRIENRKDKNIWMYWWSNIAVPQTEETRVIVPANEMFINYFGNDHYILDSVDSVPYAFGSDISYPTRVHRSLDFFYKIPKEHRKWIAAVDGNGYGLIQCSTKEMLGRKLFVWGAGAGGKNWNQYLSDGSNEGYIEIQAGLAYTQLEHIPMDANDTWSWLEAYGSVEVSSEKAHGEWKEAQDAVETELDKKFPHGMDEMLNRELNRKTYEGELLMFGSGWGALENLIRSEEGELSLSDNCIFPEESLTDMQEEWVVLLKENRFPERPVHEEPKGYLVDEKWKLYLQEAMEIEENKHWYSYMHLGVMEYALGNVEAARTYMERSLECKENAWAARNLSMLWKNEYQDIEKAVYYIQRAVSSNRICRGILLDAATVLLTANKSDEWLSLYNCLSEDLRSDGRLKFNTALAHMQKKQYKEASKYLNDNLVMPDIKEGDTAISDVWQELYSHIVAEELQTTDSMLIQRTVEEKYPLGRLDFRTH
ncbi:MAG: DUF5107 domain-containing protein [Tyzzerella sp.]|nr:DUF5107 domain-containing protein [Tyzzerella sp.]